MPSFVKRIAGAAALLVLICVLSAAMSEEGLFGFGVPPYTARIAMFAGINIILAVSLNLINGFTGQFSIGHAGFMAVGAYGSAMFTMHIGQKWAVALAAAGVPPAIAQGVALLVALLLGGSLAAVAGWLVGLPTLRLRGDYLAIVTLGFGEIIRVLILNIEPIAAARGLFGIPAWENLFWVGFWVVVVIALSFRI